ncbi:MAG: 2-hydroxychromene-2-carboxylate isomerase [Myxococcota bacterium]
MATIEMFYDIVSSYSYLASTRIEAIAADTGHSVVFRPIFLGGLMKAVGNVPPAQLPARGRHLFVDLQRWSAYYQVPLSFPSRFPMMTLTAQRALIAMAPEARIAPTHRLFEAYWVHDRDINDREVLVDILGEAEVDAAGTPEAKAALIAETGEAERRGAYGAPTFFVGDEMWFGNDRLPFLEQFLRR